MNSKKEPTTIDQEKPEMSGDRQDFSHLALPDDRDAANEVPGANRGITDIPTRKKIQSDETTPDGRSREEMQSAHSLGSMDEQMPIEEEMGRRGDRSSDDGSHHRLQENEEVAAKDRKAS